LRDLKAEGKIRVWGAAFGPAIGWLYEAVELCERESDINTIQMIWNILEQHPGTAMIEARAEHAPDCVFNVRVTHASGMLEGTYTKHTVSPRTITAGIGPELARQRPEKDSHARLSHHSDDAWPGGAQMASRRAARGDDTSKHLR
jgi:aryl-alcohol dehydrogenase-like predicted oxidoreductase